MKLRFHRYAIPEYSLWGPDYRHSPAMLQSYDEELHEWKKIDLVTEEVYSR